MGEHHHGDACIDQGLPLLLIQPLLQRLLVMGAIDEHHGAGLLVGEIGCDVMARHLLLGVVRQVMPVVVEGVEPQLLEPACSQALQSLQDGAAPIHAALAHELTPCQVEKQLLELGQLAIDQIVVTLVVVAEQAAIATGFAFLISIKQLCFQRRHLPVPTPVTDLQRCFGDGLQGRGVLHQPA